MKIKFKKLSEKAATPRKAHKTDAGFDLVATNIAHRQHYVQYDTSISVNIPEGYVGLLFPRSSVSNLPLSLANSVGVIDAGFQGEIKLRFRKTVGAAVHTVAQNEMYKVGDRIGQLVIMELPKIELEEVESFSKKSERNTGGFGSTGIEALKTESEKPKKKAKKKDTKDDKKD